jgi:hypothetical protein
MDIQELRKYRFQFEEPYLNNQGAGIALFDTSLTFLAAYLLDSQFKLSQKLPGKNKLQTYYLLVIPFGIIVHHLTAHIQQMVLMPNETTFLNKKIISTEINIYKILLIIMLYIIYTNVK